MLINACLSEFMRGDFNSFPLRDQYVVYSIRTNNELGNVRDGHCVMVVDWTLCNPPSLDYHRNVVWRTIAEVSCNGHFS